MCRQRTAGLRRSSFRLAEAARRASAAARLQTVGSSPLRPPCLPASRRRWDASVVPVGDGAVGCAVPQRDCGCTRCRWGFTGRPLPASTLATWTVRSFEKRRAS